MELLNCEDMRDSRGIESGATGLLKIIFPNKEPYEEEFYRYCVNPALEMRQRIRDELCKLDREYTPITMKSVYPDSFQQTHHLPVFVDQEKVANFDPSKKIELDDREIKYDENGNTIFPDEEEKLEKINISFDLRELNERIEQIELSLRALVHRIIGDNPDNIPPHIIKRIDDRIQHTINKNPIPDTDHYQTIQGKLEFMDLRELEDTIVSKSLWQVFEPIFVNKNSLGVKFSQLAELRNCIRHSRTLNEVTKKEGEAAIIWFEQILQN